MKEKKQKKNLLTKDKKTQRKKYMRREEIEHTNKDKRKNVLF